jgi:hypothetical protein
VNEDSWTFSMELDNDQLLRGTTEDSRSRRVEWTGGGVRVHVNTTKLPDGYSRTIVRASFRGYGRSADQFATQKEYWQLESNDNFENSIVSALRSHFTTTSSAGTRPRRISPGIPLLAAKTIDVETRHGVISAGLRVAFVAREKELCGCVSGVLLFAVGIMSLFTNVRTIRRTTRCSVSA